MFDAVEPAPAPASAPRSAGRVPLGRYRARRPEGEPVARLSHVGYSFDGGATWALRDVSLTVGARERVCIMGANGSGKTTLALLIAGLRAPDEGTVELMGRVCFADGVPDADAYRAARREAGLVFQDPQDQIVTTVVADDVAFGPENLGLPSRVIGHRVARELDRVHALDLAESDPTRLSGGQTQRVAIAGAMAMEPALVVFDEATAFLDVRAAAALRRVAQRLSSVCAQVWVSHAPEDAADATRLVILEHGRVVYDGDPAGAAPTSAHSAECAGASATAPAQGVEGEYDEGAARTNQRMASHATGSHDESSAESGLPGRSPRAPRPERTVALASAAPAPVNASAAPAPERADIPAAAPSAREPVWRARDLAFSYGERRVLGGIDLEVRPGEVVALVGATGSGKTTLARLLAGIAESKSGELTALGQDLATAAGRRAASGRIGFVMQRPERQLFAQTVAEDVAFGPRNLGLSEDDVQARVEAAFAGLGIAPLAGRSPFELSGGQQRLVALAGVLALEPEAWVMDEPLAGLDAAARERVLALIDGLARQGRAVVVVTHDMDQAASATRVLAMGEGAIALEGTPDEVFSQREALVSLGLAESSPHRRPSRGAAEREPSSLATGEAHSDANSPLSPSPRECTRGESPASRTSRERPPRAAGTQPAPAVPPRAASPQPASAVRPHTLGSRPPLQTLDPRAKVCLAVALMILSFAVAAPAQAALAAAMVFLLIGLGDLRVGRFWLSILPVLLPLALIAALNLIVTRTGPVIWAFGPFSITQGGALTALAYGFRVTLIVCFGAILLQTTTPTALTDALAGIFSPLARLGAPIEEWAFVLSLALRFVPTLGDEFQAIREAQASRGGTVARGRPAQRLRALVALMVPVLAASMRHAEGLSLALDSRAWESGAQRSRWHPLRFSGRDAAALSVVALYALVLFALA